MSFCNYLTKEEDCKRAEKRTNRAYKETKKIMTNKMRKSTTGSEQQQAGFERVNDAPQNQAEPSRANRDKDGKIPH